MSLAGLVQYNNSSDEDEESPHHPINKTNSSSSEENEKSEESSSSSGEESPSNSKNGNSDRENKVSKITKRRNRLVDMSISAVSDDDQEEEENSSKSVEYSPEKDEESNFSKGYTEYDPRGYPKTPKECMQRAIEMARQVQNMEPGKILIPPPVKKKLDSKSQEKFKDFRSRQEIAGSDFNHNLETRKAFLNPSCYHHLKKLCGVKEFGTNQPPEVFDPQYWRKQPDYQVIQRIQRAEYTRRSAVQAAKEKNTKVEHVVGTAKKSYAAAVAAAVISGSGGGSKPGSRQNSGEPRSKKSKWDKTTSDMNLLASNKARSGYPFSVTTSSNASKTSIPAIGKLGQAHGK